MRTNRACYSYSALYRCAEAVKATTWTVRRSAEHFSKCFEIKKIFELCYEETHCLLFEPDFSPWYDYLKAVDRKETKKVLDRKLRTCHRFVCNQLTAILTDMNCGEVDAID